MRASRRKDTSPKKPAQLQGAARSRPLSHSLGYTAAIYEIRVESAPTSPRRSNPCYLPPVARTMRAHHCAPRPGCLEFVLRGWQKCHHPRATLHPGNPLPLRSGQRRARRGRPPLGVLRELPDDVLGEWSTSHIQLDMGYSGSPLKYSCDLQDALRLGFVPGASSLRRPLPPAQRPSHSVCDTRRIALVAYDVKEMLANRRPQHASHSFPWHSHHLIRRQDTCVSRGCHRTIRAHRDRRGADGISATARITCSPSQPAWRAPSPPARRRLPERRSSSARVHAPRCRCGGSPKPATPCCSWMWTWPVWRAP